MKKNITIVDVARDAGVSIGTVSRVLNGHNVNAKLKEKVLQTSDRLQYTPNIFARNLQAEKTGTVGILLHHRLSMDSSWAQKIVLWLARVLTDYGYRSMLMFHDGRAESPPDLIDLVDGAIVWGSFEDQFYRILEKRKRPIPLVSYSSTIPYRNSSAVILRNAEATRQAVEHLLAAGHRRIGLVVSTRMQDRVEAWQQTMAAFNRETDPKWVETIGNERDAMDLAYDATKKMVALADPPSAIVYGSDIQAIGGLEALKHQNMDVPGDVSIIGFDNISESQVTFPKLTTMGVDPKELTKTLVENLEHRLAGRKADDIIYLSRHLVRRDSVAVRL